MSLVENVCQILVNTLQLRNARLQPNTALLGALPELDSMAVLNLLLALEQQFKIRIADDEVRAEHFATVASLTSFVQGKLI